MYDLKKFKMPSNFRGKNIFYVQIWWLVHSTLFAMSPQVFYRWRVFLLKLFGAKVGRHVIIRPSVKIVYPWKLTIGDYSWIGDNVELYTLGEIIIGENTVISQRSYLCTGGHDYGKETFDIYAEPIRIGDSCWLATDVFVSPGVTIEDNCVIGARSSVYKDISKGSICHGNPAKFIRNK
jgi:putative colanic acid biosynthesis acetyltransferase WcaF